MSKLKDIENEITETKNKLATLEADLRFEQNRAMSEIEMLRRFRYLAGNRVSTASNPVAVREEDEYWRLMDLTYGYGEKGRS